jgi:hypothetical protein
MKAKIGDDAVAEATALLFLGGEKEVRFLSGV